MLMTWCLLLTSNDKNYIVHLITRLNLVFEMKNLGCLHHFLGLEVNRTPDGIFSSQTKYAKDLLVRASMLDAKPIGSPPNYKASTQPHHSTLKADPSLYRSIAGALQYLNTYRAGPCFCSKPSLPTYAPTQCHSLHYPQKGPPISQRHSHIWCPF